MRLAGICLNGYRHYSLYYMYDWDDGWRARGTFRKLLERQADLRQRVLGAVTYPLFLLAVGGVVVTGMMVFFVPKFAPLFERLRQRGELPIATRLLLSVSQHLQQYGVWWLLLAMLAKENALTFVAVIPLTVWFFGKGSDGRTAAVGPR